MIFRWSIWGKNIFKNIELLRYSILTFKKQFGNNQQYIVYTDNLSLVSRWLEMEAEVRRFPADDNAQFCIKSKATWLKWCPSSRLDVNQTEIFIDTDVFLLKYPKEIDLFLSNTKMKFAILDEFKGQSFQHGAMKIKASPDTPFINAGFFIQKAGSDITGDLFKEYNWWNNHIKHTDQTHHDEQGALAIALTKYFKKGELYVLPKEKYMIISETSNPDIENFKNVILFHATYPTHPAFYKFKHILDKIINS